MLKRFNKRLRLPILLIIAILLAAVVPQTNVYTISADNSFTFAVTSDMQGHSGSTHDSSSYFRGVCEKIAALGEAAFMVSPGDLDPPSDVDWTIRKYLGQDYLWYPGVGNHDEETPSEMTWLRAYNYDLNGSGIQPDIFHTGPPNGVETNYSFDYGNSHFVMLNEYYNGSSDTGTDGDVVDALYNWLAADLNTTDKAHVFVFGHEPAYPQPDADNGVLRHLGDSLDKYPAHRDRFWNLLRDKNVVAYFHGHTHSYSAVKTNGVWELDSGHSQGTGETGTPSTFLMVHINGDTVTFDTYRLNGGLYTNNHSGVLTNDLPAGTIAVTDFPNYRVFQRDIGGMSKSITISGIYSNMDWNHVDARILQHGTDTAVVDWTPIDTTPGGGTFSGSLVVLQGGWYNVEVRALDSAGSVLGSNRGVNKWGVGMGILCIGQSNMVGHGQQPFTAASSDLAVNYSNAGVWEHLADPYDDGSPQGTVDNDNATAGGSMIPALANSLLQTFDFPIAFVPSAKDGSNLYSQWAYRNPSNHFDTSTLYGQSITKAQSVGGVELIIMHQGEADTNAHRTETQYEADFATLIGHYRQDLYVGIPIFICQLGTIDLVEGDARTNADVQAVRNAQHDLDNGSNILMAATAMDQPRLDEVHYTQLGLDAIGERIAQAIKYYRGTTSYYRGPAITSAAFAGNRSMIDVQIVHRGGNDFTPTSGITGFSVLSNGSPLNITSAVRIDANRIRLTLTTAAPSGTAVILRYLWGADPDNTGLVKDNSSLVLPLENTTADIIVTSTNTPPMATDDTYTVNEDNVLTIASPGVLNNDNDADGNPLTAVKVDNPAHGTLTLNTNGSFTYTSTLKYNGSDTFTYQAYDGQAYSNTATVTITINSVNDPPVAVNDTYSTNQDTALNVSAPGVLINDSDVESSPLSAILATSTGHGILTLNSNGSFSYVPTAGYSGTDTFTYKVNDGQADSNTVTVTIQVTAQSTPSSSLSFGGNDYVTFGDLDLTGSFTIEFWMKANSKTGWASVIMKNTDYGLEFDPQGRLSTSLYNGSTWDGYIYYPDITTGQWHHITMVWDEVGNDLYLYVDGVMVGSDLNRGDHRSNNNPLRIGAWNTSSEYFNGLIDEVRISNIVRYTSNFTPPTTLLLADSSTVALWHLDEGTGQTVTDNSGHGWNGVLGSSTAVQSSDPAWSSDSPITTSTNKSPVVVNDNIITDEDTAANINVLSNDTDPDGDTLNVASVTQGSHGSVQVNPNSTLVYTPAANFHGTDSFTYTASDGKGSTTTATVNVIVNSVNDTPIASNLMLTTVEDNTVTIVLTANDVDGDPLTFIVLSQPSSGSLSGTAPNLNYTPLTGYTGEDHFTFKVNDGQADSNVATVTITINAVNHLPIAVNDTYTVNEDNVLTIASPGVLNNDNDADGNPLTAVKVDNPAHGTLTLNTNGSFTYTSTLKYNGSDTFTYQAYDGQAYSNTATVTITINSVNDPPVAVNDTYSTNQNTTLNVSAPGVLTNDSDVESSPLSAILVTSTGHGILTLNSNGSLSYVPTAGYSGTDTFTYKVNDGQADSNTVTVTIQVTAQSTPSSSLSFGGNDYVTFGDLDLTGSFTIEFWMKANSKTGWASLVMKNTDYGLEFDPQGRLSTSLYNGSTWGGYIYYPDITTGQWHHITMVWDEVGNDLYLYVDGVMVGSDLNRGDHRSNNNPLRIGAWNTGSEYFNGLIDEVRISNIVRYTSNFTPPTTLLQADSSTVALWHLDEGTGQTVTDNSGHGWNGVLGSSTAVQSSDPAWSSDSPVTMPR